MTEINPFEDFLKIIEPVKYDDNRTGYTLCDIDGTIAGRFPDRRGPYEWDKVITDYGWQSIIDLTRNLIDYDDDRIIFITGRKECCRNQTFDWLKKYSCYYGDIENINLLMRSDDDNRPGYLTKYDLFNQHIRDKYNVEYVLDNSYKLCKMWQKLGLTTLHIMNPIINSLAEDIE